MKLEFEEDLFSDQFKTKENSLLFNVDHKKNVIRKELVPFIYDCYFYEVKIFLSY